MTTSLNLYYNVIVKPKFTNSYIYIAFASGFIIVHVYNNYTMSCSCNNIQFVHVYTFVVLVLAYTFVVLVLAYIIIPHALSNNNTLESLIGLDEKC